MGKGSNPRNCFTSEFRDNYDQINWSRDAKQNVTSTDAGHDAERHRAGSETLMGMIRQSNQDPLEQPSCGCEENNCCAND